MNFDIYIDSCNSHHSQETKHFHHPQEIPSDSHTYPLLLALISPGFISRVLSFWVPHKCNHMVFHILNQTPFSLSIITWESSNVYISSSILLPNSIPFMTISQCLSTCWLKDFGLFLICGIKWTDLLSIFVSRFLCEHTVLIL